jgi:O-antigen ligase
MIIDSGIRLSWLVFVVLSFIVFNFIFSKNKIIIFPLITALLVFMVFINGGNIVKNRVVTAYDNITQWSQGENRTSSVGIRLEMYESGIQAFKEKPFFGHGYLRGTKEVSRYVDVNARERVRHFIQLHNEYITTIIEKGMLGLASLLLILFIPFFVFVSNYDRSDIYIRLGIVTSVSFILFGAFNVSFGDTTMKAFYVFFLCILLPKFVNERQTK